MRTIRTSSYYLFLFLILRTQTIRAAQCDPCNGVDPSTEGTCAELVQAARGLSSGSRECSVSQLALYQAECCEQSPRSPCSLCPNGAPFIGSIVVPNFDPNNGDVSCADINKDGAYLDYIFESGTCDDTLLRRSASWCGCPGVQRKCSLCKNGERPPNPNLAEPVYYGWDCDAFDFVSSYFSEDECGGLVDDILEFDAPSYCGCPDSPIPDVCNLCPAGEALLYPHKRLGDDKFTCQELALSTRYIPSAEPCDRVLAAHQESGYIEQCCGVPGASNGVVQAPTGASSPNKSGIGRKAVCTGFWACIALLHWVI